MNKRVWDAAIDLQLERQIGLNWCWAATAKGVVDYYGGPQLAQCRYATHFLGETESCCDGDERTERCDVAHDVDSVLRHFGVYAPPPFRRGVSLETLRRELDRDRPVVALMRFGDGTVHSLVVTAVDVANERIGFSDPWYGPTRDELSAHAFATNYELGGRWMYTILTRPPHADFDAAVSFLHVASSDDGERSSHAPRRTHDALELDVYEVGPAPLAAGAGPQAAERVAQTVVRLDSAPSGDRDPHGATPRWERALRAMRGEIDARVAHGYEVRLLRVPSLLLTSLWFVRTPPRPNDPDAHFLPIAPVPQFVEAGQDYTLRDFRELLVEPARRTLRSLDVNRAAIARLDEETSGGDPERFHDR